MSIFIEYAPYLAGIGMFVFLGVMIYFIVNETDDRVSARASLKALDGYHIDEVVKRRLAGAKSLNQKIVELGRRFTKQGLTDSARHKLAIAGKPSADDLDRYHAMRFLSLFATVVLPALVWALLPIGGDFVRLIATVGVGIGAFRYPDIWVNKAKNKRQREIRRQLPDVLDLLTISVEAGLGFEQAVDQVIISVPGDLSEEFSRMLVEMRSGASRTDAMKGIDERTEVPEVKSFVLSIVQADQFGVSIGRILRSQADEMRIKRRQLAQEKAMKLPVKMLLPMVTCIFPSIFVVVLAPAFIGMIGSAGF